MTAHRILKLFLRAERELSHPRVQSVSPDNEVHFLGRAALKSDPCAQSVLLDRGNGVSEDRFHTTIQQPVDCCGDICACQGGDTTVG
jgi:hypothetical protein